MFRTLRFYHSFFKFLSTPSARRATSTSASHAGSGVNFYPRPPRGGRRSGKSCRVRPLSDFYPRPPRGGRLPKLTTAFGRSGLFLSTPSARRATCLQKLAIKSDTLFLSTPSARRATREFGRTAGEKKDFYPRPPRGGRRWHPWRVFHLSHISIHALREEGDCHADDCRCIHVISIHALLAEGDARADGQRDRADHFYPRPPRGGRPLTARQILPASDFYPRPPRGGRQEQRCGMILHPIFLSTPSSRRATARGKLRACGRGISIHALLAEGDHRLILPVW